MHDLEHRGRAGGLEIWSHFEVRVLWQQAYATWHTSSANGLVKIRHMGMRQFPISLILKMLCGKGGTLTSFSCSSESHGDYEERKSKKITQME